MMTDEFNPTWDLDVIFPGGSKSAKFQKNLDSLAGELHKLSTLVNQLKQQNSQVNVQKLIDFINLLEKNTKQLRESFAFISCLNAQDVNDHHAQLLVGKRNELNALMNTIQ